MHFLKMQKNDAKIWHLFEFWGSKMGNFYTTFVVCLEIRYKKNHINVRFVRVFMKIKMSRFWVKNEVSLVALRLKLRGQIAKIPLYSGVKARKIPQKIDLPEKSLKLMFFSAKFYILPFSITLTLLRCRWFITLLALRFPN